VEGGKRRIKFFGSLPERPGEKKRGKAALLASLLASERGMGRFQEKKEKSPSNAPYLHYWKRWENDPYARFGQKKKKKRRGSSIR